MASWHPLTGYHQGGDTLSDTLGSKGPSIEDDKSPGSGCPCGSQQAADGDNSRNQSPRPPSSCLCGPTGGVGVSLLPDGGRKRREIEEGESKRSRNLDKKSKEAEGFADS